MKTPLTHSLARILPLVVLGLAATTTSADAATNYWSGAGFDPTVGGSGTWDNMNSQWSSTPGVYTAATWMDNDDAIINAGTGTITIGDNLQIGSLSFAATSGSYTFDAVGSGYSIDFNGTGISTATAATQIFTSDVEINFNAGASAGASTITIDNLGIVNFSGAGATAGTSTINSIGQLSFDSGSSSSGATITNEAILEFVGTATGGATTLLNGGALDISAVTTGGITMNSVDNMVGGLAGNIVLGTNTLTLTNGLTLATTGAPVGSMFPNVNGLSFRLDTPPSTTDGSIVITGGVFTGSGTQETEITLVGPATPGAPNVPFVLIDWTAASATGVSLSDFALATSPASIGLPGYSLRIDGSRLVLVPEPATFAMPLAAVLGMLTLRRRSRRTS